MDSDKNQKAKVLILHNGTRIENWTNFDKPLEDLLGLIPYFNTTREESSQPEIKNTAMWIIRSWCFRWF